MTEQEARELKVGDRVQWDAWDDSTPLPGTVTALVGYGEPVGVTIAWEDGQVGGIHYRDMLHVEIAEL